MEVGLGHDPGVERGHEHDVGLHHGVPAEHHVVGSDEDLAGVVALDVVGKETGQAEDDPLMSGDW